MWLRKILRCSVFGNNFPGLVAQPGRAASTSSFLHAAMNLRLPSVTVTTHTSASNAVAFESPGLLFILPIPSSPHCNPKVSEHGSLWQQPPAAHLDERPRPQKPSRAQRRLFVCACVCARVLRASTIPIPSNIRYFIIGWLPIRDTWWACQESIIGADRCLQINIKQNKTTGQKRPNEKREKQKDKKAKANNTRQDG